LHQYQQQRMQALQAAYAEFVNTRAAIRLHDDPDFMSPVPTLEGIAHCLAGPDEALVYLVTGKDPSPALEPIAATPATVGTQPSMAVIVTRQPDQTPHAEALSLPRLTTNAIDMLIQPFSSADSLHINLEGGLTDPR
jgi:hypothetical protein